MISQTCFSVDSEVSIIGFVTSQGSINIGTTYNYELEFYKEENPRISMQLSRGSFVHNDNGSVDLKFDSPIPVQSGVKYALSLKVLNTGGAKVQFWCVNSGSTSVKGPDGTNFNFSDCPELRTMGTNLQGGLFHHILYSKNSTEAAFSEVRLFLNIPHGRSSLYFYPEISIASLVRNFIVLLTIL